MSSEIIDFYNQYLDSFGVTDPSAVGWTNKNTQHTRFKALFDVGIKDYDTILDYGCGLGHLNIYIDLIGYKNVKYFGIDINPHYISMESMMFKDQNFAVSDIEDVNPDSEFDYVIGSGVFTYGITLDQVVSKVESAFQLCKKGVAFNFLNEESEIYGLITYNKEQVIQALSHIGNLSLSDTYLGKEDFTIYIKK
jgi:SAM-dependent methyltransferase